MISPVLPAAGIDGSFLVRPRALVPGDAVAIVSPSGPGLHWWPHRAARGREYLESLGLRVKAMPHAAESNGQISADARARADDLHAAFTDPDVAAVICSTGGNHSNQILDHLDFDLIRRNPKIFQGYSDITVLHWALLKRAGLVTFYGPAIAMELGEYPKVFDYTDECLRRAWFHAEAWEFRPAPGWTDEFVPWDGQADLTQGRELRPNEGWHTVRPGTATGWSLGGALEPICWHLKGSPEWMDPTGAILVIETTAQTDSPATVDSYLTDLGRIGVLDALAGMVLARPLNFDRENTRGLWEVVRRHTEQTQLPVLADVDVGHTDPMLTLPLGVRARLDAGERRLELLEPATVAGEPAG